MRQAVIGSLSCLSGKMSQNTTDLECKSIQRNLIEIYREHLVKMGVFKRLLTQKKDEMKEKYAEKGEIKSFLSSHIDNLESIFEEEKQVQEKLIRSIDIGK